MDRELEVRAGVLVGGQQKGTPSGTGQRLCPLYLSVLD